MKIVFSLTFFSSLFLDILLHRNNNKRPKLTGKSIIFNFKPLKLRNTQKNEFWKEIQTWIPCTHFAFCMIWNTVVYSQPKVNRLQLFIHISFRIKLANRNIGYLKKWLKIKNAFSMMKYNILMNIFFHKLVF